jgi:hypothetical protein
MIRLLKISLILVVSLQAYAQEYIPWESYFAADSVAWSDDFEFDEHRSIYPRINNRRTDFGKTEHKALHRAIFRIQPMSDLVFGQTFNDIQFRSGLGFSMDFLPIRGMHIKAAYVGGIANSNVINYQGGIYPFAVVRKPLSNGLNYGYHDLRARVSYSPNKHFNFQAGIDNNRFGEGDRSLLLDDYGTPYPFAQMRIKIWRFEYVSMHTYLQNPNSNFTSTRPKFSALHYLSMNLVKGFNLSFFETVVYDGMVGNQRRGIEWEYLNPFVIYRPIEFTLGSTDKVQMGANLSYRFNSSATLYAQIMIDEFKINELRARNRNIANKFGYQLGVKGTRQLENGQFKYLSEINLVRPYTYGHANPGQAFTNMSNPLAHPLGSNFIENSSRILYSTGRWDYTLDFVYYLRGNQLENNDTNWGGDVNLSTTLSPFDENMERIQTGFFIGSGNKTNVAKIQAGVGYMLLPEYRIRAFINLESLWVTNLGQTTYYQGIFLGIRSELWNDRRNY